MTHQRKHLRRSKYGRRFVAGKRKISHHEYLYGDFDRDKIPNIDDKKPFEYSIGTVEQTQLHKEIKAIKSHAKEFGPEAKKVAGILKKHGFFVKFRVKAPFSVINKLRRRYLSSIEDMGGVLIVTNNENEVFKAGDFVEHNFNVVDVDNYYKYPKDKYYRALHYTINYQGKMIEIQIKTRKDAALHQREHEKYKQGDV